MPPLTQPYLTLDDVVAGFGELESDFRRTRDRRSVFLTLYGIVSSAIREAVRRGAFEDEDWVERYAVAFANLYRIALEHYGSGQLERVPKAWVIGFDAARAGQGLVLQDMLLGVNAHVNNDLPLALLDVGIGPDRASRYRDHTAVNRVLASVTERATERLMALYAPGLGALDEAAGHVDELISAFSLEVARESAWDGALALADARSAPERAVRARLLSARAAVVAKLLRALEEPGLRPRLSCAGADRLGRPDRSLPLRPGGCATVMKCRMLKFPVQPSAPSEPDIIASTTRRTVRPAKEAR